MLKKKLLIFVSSILFYSCGSKSASNTGSTGTTTTSSIYANPGPTSCLSSSVSFEGESPYYENFREALASPFKRNLSRQNIEIAEHPAQEINQNRNLQLVNGNGTTTTMSAGANTNCQSATNSPSAKTIVTTNTVAITIPVPSSSSSTLCTGALVGDGAGGYLVLTAAHCFNSVTDFTSRTAGGALVYFDNTASIINSTNYTAVSCWQRHPYYRSVSSTTDSDVTKNLFDIAWIKLADAVKINSQSYAITPLLATPSQMTATTEKLLAGFGAITDGGSSDGLKRCATTTSASIDTNYAIRGDVIPTGAVSSYNSQAISTLGTSIVGSTPFESYLAVIGPINGGSSISVGRGSNSSGSYNYASGILFATTANTSGTCFGDSGGPVYIYANSKWVLSALTEGADSLLTPHPIINFTAQASANGLNAAANFNTSYSALCADGYGTYTTLGNYLTWLRTSSGITLTSQ